MAAGDNRAYLKLLSNSVARKYMLVVRVIMGFIKELSSFCVA